MNFAGQGRKYAAIISVVLIVALIVASALVISFNGGADPGMEAEGQTEQTESAVSSPAGVAGDDEASAAAEVSPVLYGAFRASGSTEETALFADGGSVYAAATGPAVKTIALDADELLFDKKNRKLTLKITVTPQRANLDDLNFSSSDESVATVTKSGTVRARGWGTCRITARAGDGKAECKVTVAKKWVALTFDDGPGKTTKELLKTMKKEEARATFFVVGIMARSRESTLKAIVKNGSEIGNHTYAHNGSAGTLRDGLKKTDDIVKKATGSKTTLMRPPGGVVNNVTRSCGKSIILWSVDPKDWQDRNTNTVYNRVMDKVKSGSIILLHDIYPTSVDAAARIIKSLKKQGYAFVTVSEFLGEPEANKVYNKGPEKVRAMKIKYGEDD
jgi:peptidoglycan/xylan/chitin deacetylase (PgdA/CDA1 family)